MFNHWDKYLNVKELVKELKPKLVVEMGAGSGDNTRQYLELMKTQPFKMVTISDGDTHSKEFEKTENFEWRVGISYLELPKFEDKSIDFASIDTDHNYWTMKQELNLLARKMRQGGIVVAHDTQSYRNTSGTMMKYGTDDPYPPEIERYAHIGMYEAIVQSINKRQFKVIREVQESAGAIALEKI